VDKRIPEWKEGAEEVMKFFKWLFKWAAISLLFLIFWSMLGLTPVGWIILVVIGAIIYAAILIMRDGSNNNKDDVNKRRLP
jgi:hypothetical protein